MTYVIGETCIGSMDRSCVDVCPVDCIIEATKMLVIDPGECIDCAACVSECPVDAIARDGDVTEEWAPFTAINAAITEGRERVDELVEAWLAEHPAA